MFSDTLLGVERHHLMIVSGWGLASALAGLLTLLVARGRAQRSPLLFHFGAQMLVWGGFVGLQAFGRLQSVAARDLAGAVRLDRAAWFASGLELGLAIAGVTMALTAWVSGRRLAGVGAGIAIATQGLALFLLDLQLTSAITR